MTTGPSPPFTGRCLCGGITYRCTVAPHWQLHCHCASCRRATASPFTSFFGVANGGWNWTGQPPSTYQSSPGTNRDFCRTCGTQMAYRTAKLPDETHLYAATLDRPQDYAPTGHVHADERLAWLHLADRLPKE